MSNSPLRAIDALRGPSAADLVYDELYRRIVELDLPPGAKLSEQDVARQMAVSRQPVRDAFYRLSQLGLVQIQPQRATTISLVSEEEVLRARFVRTALEVETAREAARSLTPVHREALEELLRQQEAAIVADDRIRFHALDDAFHQAICAVSGHEFAWAMIRETKAHMDRVRWLTLAFGARAALEDHRMILEALLDADPERAAEQMRRHLGRIVDLLAQIREAHPSMFVELRS